MRAARRKAVVHSYAEQGALAKPRCLPECHSRKGHRRQRVSRRYQPVKVSNVSLGTKCCQSQSACPDPHVTREEAETGRSEGNLPGVTGGVSGRTRSTASGLLMKVTLLCHSSATLFGEHALRCCICVTGFNLEIQSGRPGVDSQPSADLVTRVPLPIDSQLSALSTCPLPPPLQPGNGRETRTA